MIHEVIQDRFLECDVLYKDDQMASMGIDQDKWIKGVIDLTYVIAASEMEGGFTDVIFHGDSSIVVNVDYEAFKKIIIAIKTN